MVASMDTGAFDSGASNVSAGYQKMLNGAKQANTEAARAVRDYQKQIDKYFLICALAYGNPAKPGALSVCASKN